MGSRLQARLADALANKQFYEAQQLYHTLSFRLIARGQHDDAVSLLYTGATNLLNEQVHEGGGDLACQMVLAQAKSPSQPDAVFVRRVATLCRLMKPGTAERESLTTKSLEVLKQLPDCKQHLHREFGFNYWLERNYSLSQYHFVRSSDSGYHCGRMLVEFSQLGFKSETDLFLTRTVLQLLCLRKLSPAFACFWAFTRHHPVLANCPTPPYPPAYPLLNFTWLLLLSVRSAWPLTCFHSLCESYSPSLDRDPTCADYLTQVGQTFFGLPTRKSAGGEGLFGNLLRMLAADEPEDDEEAAAAAAAAAAAVTAAAPLNVDDMD